MMTRKSLTTIVGALSLSALATIGCKSSESKDEGQGADKGAQTSCSGKTDEKGGQESCSGKTDEKGKQGSCGGH